MIDRVKISIKPMRLEQRLLHIIIPGYCSGTLPVTVNLFHALKYLRHEAISRTFWIDAICVNQEDLDERGKQVQRMADIYR